ncbi:acyl carrier protein [Phytohabitans rumicis]|uniref:Carrier domain-containing protein n=1 Tax=Phytohabitans rumicis TaxID=1076125 RepID=A0A6V8KXD5_9ACTN|nr:acyl carrier protein [Phytohabitans rumicis]GFJ86969.1 hypothetical protein Prum_006110 [Phytohabitans rumicis]
MERAELRRRVATLIAQATDGAVPANAALAGAEPLHDLGLDSLGWLRLIDAVEAAHEVDLDLGGTDLRRITVEHIVDMLANPPQP